jgi:hypothetical protein
MELMEFLADLLQDWNDGFVDCKYSNDQANDSADYRPKSTPQTIP